MAVGRWRISNFAGPARRSRRSIRGSGGGGWRRRVRLVECDGNSARRCSCVLRSGRVRGISRTSRCSLDGFERGRSRPRRVGRRPIHHPRTSQATAPLSARMTGAPTDGGGCPDHLQGGVTAARGYAPTQHRLLDRDLFGGGWWVIALARELDTLAAPGWLRRSR